MFWSFLQHFSLKMSNMLWSKSSSVIKAFDHLLAMMDSHSNRPFWKRWISLRISYPAKMECGEQHLRCILCHQTGQKTTMTNAWVKCMQNCNRAFPPAILQLHLSTNQFVIYRKRVWYSLNVWWFQLPVAPTKYFLMFNTSYDQWLAGLPLSSRAKRACATPRKWM